ncbi:MAG: hypothetical protein GF401_14340 [Chitinivibrionales bacterium]|nr:hypothetical protein [Chitinivibrionales bacterium]
MNHKAVLIAIMSAATAMWLLLWRVTASDQPQTRIIEPKKNSESTLPAVISAEDLDSIVTNDTMPSSTDVPQHEREKRTKTEQPCININVASWEKLTELPGIGPVLSQRITAYRKQNGSFKKAADIINVKGIGPAKLEKIAKLICF